MDATTIGLIIGVLSLIIGAVSLFVTFRNGSNQETKKMRELNPIKRLDCINTILSYQHNYVLNLCGSAFIFMPDGEILFGAGWVNYEWQELLKNFLEKREHDNLTIATVGANYFLVDLISGKNIRIPLDPQKISTIDKSGIELRHLYMFVHY